MSTRTRPRSSSAGVASAAYRFQARILVHAPLAEVVERTSVRTVVLTAVDEATTLLEAGSETLYGLAFHLTLPRLGVRGAGAVRAP